MASSALITINTDTAVRLSPIGVHGGMDLTLQNVNDEGYIFIGARDTVSSTNYGFRLAPNNSWALELPGRESIYAIASVDGMSIAVFQIDLESQG
jgi:hypothetical protein